MKRLLTAFLILLHSLTSVSQETKFVTEKFSGSKQISASYSVLKSDGQTKHGEYISYFLTTDEEYKQIKKGNLKSEDFIKQKGAYKNGMKEGEWVEYSQPFELKTKGNYENDKKTGVWITSKEEGKVFERFDFDNNKKLQPFISIHAVYPKSAQEAKLEGTVSVSFQTSSDCSISGIIVTKSLSTDCDKTATEAIKKYGDLLKKYGVDCEEKTESHEVNFKLD